MIILIVNTELYSQFIGMYTVTLFLVLCKMCCVPALFFLFIIVVCMSDKYVGMHVIAPSSMI